MTKKQPTIFDQTLVGQLIGDFSLNFEVDAGRSVEFT